MATTEELLAARIVFRAVLPVIKEMIADDPATHAKFEGVTGTVQFVADDPGGAVGACLCFDSGAFSVAQEIRPDADITFAFPTVARMVAMFAGKPALPKLGTLLGGGLKNFGLLLKTFHLLLGLKLLMPTARPKDPVKARLKVKMTLYMISTALSQLNKSGDVEMGKWTGKQPDRIYQWSVEGTDIACYLRVKAGKTKAGRGFYTRRKPFVHLRFAGVDAAIPVLNNEIDTLQAMTKGLVVNDGSPEYGGKVGDFMLRIAALLS
ncbi:MAG: hypothetical protein H3C30_02875 [Candidatus Hydrogenedentes bacterium]|nr:hypothetical protein [Candidatus Hydrogenedentota bacterium]